MPVTRVRPLILVAALASAGGAADETAGWFAFKPAGGAEPTVIGMESWLDAPAGGHGAVAIDGDQLKFADGTLARFWGVNNCNQRCAPAKDEADKRADFYARYGVNAVRQHKFMETICEKDDATTISAENQELFDYNFAALKKRGIYSGWSPIYYLKIKPGNAATLLAGDELLKNVGGSTMGLVNFATDLQELHIELLTRLLTHVNAITGLKYAEDPALAYVEIQNEDDIFFYSTEPQVQKCPAYKKLLCTRFCDWLKHRYEDADGLKTAWGDKALNAYPKMQTDESLEKETIFPVCNPWFVTSDGLKNIEAAGTKQRVLDSFRFLFHCQAEYYAKAVDAIRATGFKGPIIGSPWQAAEGISHYYNLLADKQVGVVDRHNYFGGGSPNGWQFGPCAIDNGTQLARPGSGLLSTGMQQVKGRPFSVSEWDSQLPNEWAAEAAPIIAVYGMGLQGWSMSYQFASDGAGFTDRLDHAQPWGAGGIWNTDLPTKIGIYPALARLVLRGDVERGADIATRRVSLGELEQGKLGFSDKDEQKAEQKGDVKSFGGGAVPNEALAVGRVLVEYTEQPQATAIDLGKHVGPVVTSTTGQLAWDRSGKGGFFTVDTPGTKAVVGFPDHKPAKLTGTTIAVENPFAVLFITSLERGKPIAEARSLLVTAVARARNTGMRYGKNGAKLEEIGKAPLLLEGVRATITLEHAGTPTVTVLDHDGRETKKTLPVSGGRFTIDGQKEQAIYWEIAYP